MMDKITVKKCSSQNYLPRISQRANFPDKALFEQPTDSFVQTSQTLQFSGRKKTPKRPAPTYVEYVDRYGRPNGSQSTSYHPNGQRKTVREYDENNRVVRKKSYDEKGKRI